MEKLLVKKGGVSPEIMGDIEKIESVLIHYVYLQGLKPHFSSATLEEKGQIHKDRWTPLYYGLLFITNITKH